MTRFRWLSLVVALALLLNGPLSLVARAQQPQQPDLSQEPPTPSTTPAKEPGAVAYQLGAAAATLVNVPGRITTCVLGTAVGFAVLAITFGSGYRTAAWAVEDGCRGPWVLTADDLKGRPTDEVMSRY